MNTEEITANYLKSLNISSDIINDIIEQVNDSIIFTDSEGFILYSNKVATDLFTKGITNIKDIGYKFNFDIAILKKNINVIEFSPITILLESQINTRIESLYEESPGNEKLISLNSKYITDNCYMLRLTDSSPKSINKDYAKISEANIKLKEQ